MGKTAILKIQSLLDFKIKEGMSDRSITLLKISNCIILHFKNLSWAISTSYKFNIRHKSNN